MASKKAPAKADEQTEIQNQLAHEPQKKIKSKHGLKPFAFFSGIFDIGITALIVIIGIMTLINIYSTIDTGNDFANFVLSIPFWPLLITLAVMFFIAALLTLISGILTLISSFKSDRKNFNALLISIIIFDILAIMGLLIFTFMVEGKSQMLCIILLAILVIGLIFKIVDIVLTKKRLSKYYEKKQEENRNSYTGPNFDNLNSLDTQEKTTKQKTKDDDKSNSSGVDFSNLK